MVAALLMAMFAQDPPLTYWGDVRPLFARSCFGCHAAGVKMGSLDLETWDGVTRGGNNGTIVERGDPRRSRLFTMLTGEHAPAMPMDGKVLPPAQVDVVRRWIAAGAVPGTASSTPLVDRIVDAAILSDGRFVLATSAALKAERLAVGGDRVAGLFDERIDVWTPGLPGVKSIPVNGATAVALSPDGGRLAYARGRAVRVADTEFTGAQEVRALAFVGDSVVAAGDGASVGVWAGAGKPLREIDVGGESPVLAPSRDGWLAVGTARNVTLWNTKLERVAMTKAEGVSRMAWSRDGRQLAVATLDGGLRIYDGRSLALVKTLPAQRDWVHGLGFTPTGALGVARFDGSVEFY